jgi:hypothetical protein
MRAAEPETSGGTSGSAKANDSCSFDLKKARVKGRPGPFPRFRRPLLNVCEIYHYLRAAPFPKKSGSSRWKIACQRVLKRERTYRQEESDCMLGR